MPLETQIIFVMKKYIILLVAFLVSFCAYANNEGAKRGYHWNVATNFLFGNDGEYHGVNVFGGGISTTHGYQFNPRIFVGGGMALHLHAMSNIETSLFVPLYADFRFTFVDKKVTPYLEAKAGYAVGRSDGSYLSPGFGVRIGLPKDKALNLTVSYTNQGFDFGEFNHTCNIGIGLEF